MKSIGLLNVVSLGMCVILVAGCSTTGGKGSSFMAKNKTETETETNFAQEISLARLSERNGNQVGAKKIYRYILTEQPENALVLHRMGVIAGREARFEEAVGYFEKSKAAGNESAELLSDLGYVYYLNHEIERAQQTLEKAYQTDPDYEAAQTNLAIVYAEQGNDSAALSLFRHASSEAEALSNLAFIQSQRGDLELAEQNYMRALDIDRKLRPAAEALIQLAQMSGKTDPRYMPEPTIPRPGEASAPQVAQQQPVQSAPAKPRTTAPQMVASQPPRKQIAEQNPLRQQGPKPTQQPLTEKVAAYPSTGYKALAQASKPAAPFSMPQQPSTGNPANSGLVIPTEGLEAKPAVYQISDMGDTDMARPAMASSEIGAGQSASSAAFSQRVFSALKSAASEPQSTTSH